MVDLRQKSPYRSGWIRPIESSRSHRSLRVGCSDDGRRLGVNNRCQSSILILMAKSKTKNVRMLLVRRIRVPGFRVENLKFPFGPV